MTEKGLVVTARNVHVHGGEIDLLANDGGARVVVEVRTVTGPGDPIDAVDPAKRAHVNRLGRQLGASRVDFIGVGLRHWGLEMHWVPG